MRALSAASAIASLLALVIVLFGVKSVTIFSTTIYAEDGTTVFGTAFLVLVSLVASSIVAVKLFRAPRPAEISGAAPSTSN